ncbi:hypothetical protein MPH_11788 [Macrophomina phaseolina MS6]|uniref:Uncharacterized protein n=1 Tax=Macrophomina phaseolina (strain MS6) TaxID=1126212 RepID=K2S2Z2_MACPH|nr:hypothetical protein MPH_11788 [Macrophomina phaseolina MS6]
MSLRWTNISNRNKLTIATQSEDIKHSHRRQRIGAITVDLRIVKPITMDAIKHPNWVKRQENTFSINYIQSGRTRPPLSQPPLSNLDSRLSHSNGPHDDPHNIPTPPPATAMHFSASALPLLYSSDTTLPPTMDALLRGLRPFLPPHRRTRLGVSGPPLMPARRGWGAKRSWRMKRKRMMRATSRRKGRRMMKHSMAKQIRTTR